MNGIELAIACRSRSRYFPEIRSDILKTLIEILDDRFLPDRKMFEIVDPFIQYKETVSIQQIQTIFGADLPLATLSLQFTDLVQLKLCKGLSLTDQIKKLIEPNNLSKFDLVLAILCRIKACTPQSADVERSIKANNLFKTAFRTRFNLDTENKYMYVHFNMPPLETWNPRKAISIWLNQKQRREHIDLFQKDTALKRPYFQGIFQMAQAESDDD